MGAFWKAFMSKAIFFNITLSQNASFFVCPCQEKVAFLGGFKGYCFISYLTFVLDPKIKNIIFDLGGVILNLSVDSTLRKFAELSNIPFHKVIETYHSRPEFLAYEKGEITNDEFRAALRNIFGLTATDLSLDECWNAMLGDIPVERIQLLRELKSKYRTFL